MSQMNILLGIMEQHMNMLRTMSKNGNAIKNGIPNERRSCYQDVSKGYM
jgi:hypothetical protein